MENLVANDADAVLICKKEKSAPTDLVKKKKKINLVMGNEAN